MYIITEFPKNFSTNYKPGQIFLSKHDKQFNTHSKRNQQINQ